MNRPSSFFSSASSAASSRMSTHGIVLKTKWQWLRRSVELLSSMRFAIAMLVLVAVTSMIGTLIKQGESAAFYIEQYGVQWHEVFQVLGFYEVYNAPWFLLVLAFLVISTSLCVSRHTPKVLRYLRGFQQHIRLGAIRAQPIHAEWQSSLSLHAASQTITQQLQARGYATRIDHHEAHTLISAKKGQNSRLGYVFSHVSIVVICLGGVLDSQVPLKLITWWQDKQPLEQNMLLKDVPERARLGVDNPTFRANLFVPEGERASHGLINTPKGLLVQDLPFELLLKQFTVDFYSTGMPKLFASDVVVTDKITGQTIERRIEVNKPLTVNGITIYQSSFEDGGSLLKTHLYDLQGSSIQTVPLSGKIGDSIALNQVAGLPESMKDRRLEWSDFRLMNIEDLSGEQSSVAQDSSSSTQKAMTVFGSAVNADKNKHLNNVGPAFQYKIRDAAGQAVEYKNYMLPVTLDGAPVFLSGVRTSANQPFRYVRLPADEQGSLTELMRLRAAVFNPALRQKAAQRYADQATQKMTQTALQTSPLLRQQLQTSAQRALDLFATQGLQSIADFIAKAVPTDEQEKAAGVFIKMTQGALWELWQVSRMADGLPVLTVEEKRTEFIRLAQIALSDLFFYETPLFIQLDDFTPVKASVFQLTRSPGQFWVYGGCVLLVLGVFAMFYIRERRVWVWLAPSQTTESTAGSIGCTLALGMTSPKRTFDFSQEAQELVQAMQRMTETTTETVAKTHSPSTPSEVL
jgi:cytochrome c biogenesis protein